MNKIFYILAFSCSINSFSQIDLVDQWLRLDDRALNPNDEDMPTQDSTVIDVKEENGAIVGVLIRIPKTSKQYGYSAGQVKWKNLRMISDNNFECEALLMEYGASGKFDVPTYLKVQLELAKDKNTILLWTDNQGDRFNWSRQKWIRLPKL